MLFFSNLNFLFYIFIGDSLDKYGCLKEVYGYEEFRNGQDEIIDCLIDGNDSIIIMSTGGGKSICFQIPALLKDGMTIVVTPLISLMYDQVLEVRKKGINARYINSSLSSSEMIEVEKSILRNEVKILYTSPERLLGSFFLKIIEQIKVEYIIIDEAHTILWHLDFRKSFLNIGKFISSFKCRPIIGCFTATATKYTISEICAVLGINEFKIFKMTFDRKNLLYKVIKSKDKKTYIYKYIKLHIDECGIIYCLTRKMVMELYMYLLDNDISVTYYHGGLDTNIKNRNQKDFLYSYKKIMICTISFGMGINKPDIRYILNYDMPSSLEDLAQMTGRCSRDNEFGECVILYDNKDILTSKYFIDSIDDEDKNRTDIYKIKKYRYKQLEEVIRFCKTKKCLHKVLAEYFNEKVVDCKSMCSNCQKKHFIG